MLVVGLTGGIASGKSTVSNLLRDKYRVPLIDLDVLAREVVRPNDSSQSLKKLVDHFGRAILNPDGTLNRPSLGRMCFGQGEQAARNRKVLNGITHSAIRKRMAWKLMWNWLVRGDKVTVVDTPLLIEAGLWKFVGQLVVVWCSPEDQLTRMLSRDGPSGLTEEDARSRLSSQDPLRSKLPYADVVLDNSSALSSSTTTTTTSPSDGTSSSSSSSQHGGASEVLTAQVGQLVYSWQTSYGGLFGSFRWLLSWLVPPLGLLLAVLCIWSRWNKVQLKLKESEESDRRAEVRRSRGSL